MRKGDTMISITREEPPIRMLGESIGAVQVNGNLAGITPNIAITSYDLNKATALGRDPGMNVVYPHEFLDIKWFWKATDFKGLNPKSEAAEAHVGYINEMLKARPKFAIYTPTFSSKINNKRKEIDMLLYLCENSEIQTITLKEAFTPNYTAKLIEWVRAKLKKDKIEKDLMLLVKIDQLENNFAAKYKLGNTETNGVIAEYCNPKLRPENYALMARHSSLARLRVLTGIPKVYPPKNGYAGISPNMCLFADIVSIAPPQVFGSSDADKKKRQKHLTEEKKREIGLTNVAKHVSSSDLYLTRAGLKKEGITKQFCLCPPDIDVNGNVEDYFMEHERYLYNATVVHNAFSTHDLMVQIRDKISSGKLNTFFKSMEGTKKVTTGLLGLGFGTQQKIVV